jgi:hypothetical protein
VIYTAMTGVLNVPNDDRFMVITEHDQADLVISPEHLGIGHTADVVLIQVTRNEGRTVPVKWDFYRPAPRGRDHLPGRGEKGKLVIRQWHRPVCLDRGEIERYPLNVMNAAFLAGKRGVRPRPSGGRCGRPLAVPGREPAP